MSETTGRTPLRRKKLWSFLVVDGLALTFLLGAFAGTENCTNEAGVTTTVSSIACGINRVTKRVTNNSAVNVLISDQMMGLKTPSTFEVDIESISHSDPTQQVRIDPCPPAERQLNVEFPPGVNEKWTAFLVPAVFLDPGEIVTLVYVVSSIGFNVAAQERATALGCDFTNPSRSYFNSISLVRSGCNPPAGVPSLSPMGRLLLVLVVSGAGLLFVGRRFRERRPFANCNA